jgi:uncharacterized protein (TIGR03437 family)
MAKLFKRLAPPSTRCVGAWIVLVACLHLTYPAVYSQASGRSGVSAPEGPQPPSPETSPAHEAQFVRNYGNLPLSFEANTGQADNSVRFLSRGIGYELYLTGDEVVLALRKGGCAAPASSAGPAGFRYRQAGCKQNAGVVRMRLAGAGRGRAAAAGEEQLPGTANYFVGNDPARWHSSVPTYAKVRYRDVYPGVDLVYYGNQRQLEFDFVVAPGVDPKPIRLQFAGTKGLRLGAGGDLVVTAAGGALTFHRPVVYQSINGQRKTIEAGFALLGGSTVGFQLGSYDREKPLVIDPVLVYSTYLGGSGNDVTGSGAIAVDTAGNVYVAGTAASTDFPVTAGAFQKTNHATAKTSYAFIAKLNPSGTALVYSTYLGGSGGDGVRALKVDGSGSVYVAGTTFSTDFPVTQGVFQTTNQAGARASSNAFIAKLNPSGSALVYSTYLGGSGIRNSYGHNLADAGIGLAVDGSGNAYITGSAYSRDFPITAEAFQTANIGAMVGAPTVFVSKLNPAGTALVYSTYLGGSVTDIPSALVVDGSGSAYVTGLAYSNNFPVTPGAFQTTNRGGGNAFITKLNPYATALVYSTYLGGSTKLADTIYGPALSEDAPYGLAVDGSGNAYVVGYAFSTDFPVTSGAFQTTKHARTGLGQSGADAFVSKLNPTGGALVYSTYLGGSTASAASGVAVDGSGNAYVVGGTSGSDFPVTSGAFQTMNRSAGMQNGFVAKLNPAGNALVYSTYVGGTASDAASGVVLDPSGNVYVSGQTSSTDFPLTQGAFQTVNHAVGGAVNAFVAKLNLSAVTPSITPGGIVPAGSTVGTIQPGEWVSIYGTNLAGSTVTWNQDFPRTLGGTTVTINGKEAYLWYVSPGQINLQAPDDTATGTVPVVVTTAAGSARANVTLAAYAPSFLLLEAKHVAGVILRSDGSGAYGGGTYDIIGPTGTSLGYPTVAAKAGDNIELFGTGFGPTNPVVAAGQAFTGAAATASVSVLINNVSVTPAFAGLSGAGLVQINLTVPSGLGSGDVSLMATVGGVRTPSNVLISLR